MTSIAVRYFFLVPAGNVLGSAVSVERTDRGQIDNVVQSVVNNNGKALNTSDVIGGSQREDNDVTKKTFKVPGWPPEVSFNVTHYVDLDVLNTSLLVPTLRTDFDSKSKQKCHDHNTVFPKLLTHKSVCFP